ncbi:MAG: efflux RND transporter periplasmic adaptor subunit [bacterium]
MEPLSNKWKKIVSRISIVAVITIAFILGFVLGGAKTETRMGGDQETLMSEGSAKAQIWTCSMHPQIRELKQGKCRICGMDLIPATSGESDAGEGPRELNLSPRAEKLAAIEVAPVERKHVEAEIRMVGKVEYDESRIAYITSWVPGRLDRLYVDYTGVPVKKGDHLVYLYSPDLITAQQELIQSLKTSKELAKSNLSSIRETTERTVESVREKLRLWGLTDKQIEEIESRAKPTDHMTIYAPISGIVIHKNAVEGMYVNTGTQIYTIADLSRVWVKLDAYESDLMWIRYGQEVEFYTEAYPGESFKGKIAFIDPVLNAKTRTVKVRVNVPNAEGRLKPEMFVRAVVRAKVAVGGQVMDPSLAGKWICPMHPEIIKNSLGSCDICEMPLVRAESLGYTSVGEGKKQAPLVIPVSAPLITGKRAVVYVARRDRAGAYEGREVVLGPRAGDYYLVQEGLEEGELVVVNGNFKIDSALQIVAKPSMMSPEGDRQAIAHDHGAGSGTEQTQSVNKSEEKPVELTQTSKDQVNTVMSAYFDIQRALGQDDLNKSQSGAKNLVVALEAVDMSLLKDSAHEIWMKELKDLKKSAQDIPTAENIGKMREHFALLSESLITTAKRFNTGGMQPILRFHCPMAFDGRGADWLQNQSETENPYFGQAMFRCGEQVESISPIPEGK